ncbi:MAG TPA: CcoQ/FixQ family Cbb3-type cytochrome c oxidase assembly chaperone [Gillisia sp.]|nr:CcoQ/FixQ family Cbb3-type cytochrome c oxidase assembly chaperone [Gillisia sp.]
MLKFIEGHMSSIEGIEIYPIISLLIFFIFFVLLISWVITAKKEYVEEVSKIPFESNNEIEL